jgi:hypothetical protein
MRFFIFFLTVVVAIVSAGRAPDKAPDLPAGWCTPVYGTATRTTAECMCRHDCRGPGCKREQGFIWYDGLTCPSPKCDCLGPAEIAVPSEENEQTASSSSSSRSSGGVKKNSKSDSGPRPASTRRSSKTEQEVPPEFHKELDESRISIASLLYFLEDNSNAIFAAFFVLIVILCVVFVGLNTSPSSSPSIPGPASVAPAIPPTDEKVKETSKSK